MTTDRYRRDGVPPMPLDDKAGPAPRLPPAQARAMVERALDEGEQAAGAVATSRRPRGFGLKGAAAAVVLLLGVGSAAAAYWWAQPRRAPASSSGGTASGPDTTAPGAPASASRTEDEARSAGPEPSTLADTGTRPDTAARPGTGRDATGRDAQPRRARPSQREVEDWMQRANRLRAEGRWARAERAYRRVYEQRPTSMSAYVARVAAASLRLEHLDDAHGARRIWRRALEMRPASALEVEILQGIAAASRELGDRKRELRTLQRLIAHHPGTRAATRAERRVAELQPPE